MQAGLCGERAWLRHWLRKVRFSLDIECEKPEIRFGQLQQAIQSIALLEHDMRGVLLKVANRSNFEEFCRANRELTFPKGRYLSIIREGDFEELFGVLIAALAPEHSQEQYEDFVCSYFNRRIAIRENYVDDISELYAEIACPQWIDGLQHAIVYFNNHSGDHQDQSLETYGDLIDLLEEYYSY